MNMQTLPNPAEIAASLGLDGRGRRRRWMSRAIWAALILAVIAGAIWWNVSRQSANSTISYATQPAERRDLTVQVQATGNIQPTNQVDVSSELSGVIRSVAVDYNSQVKRGDVLAELDATKIKGQIARSQASLAAAKANVLTAQATVDETEITLQRAQSLANKGVSSAQDLNTAEAAHNRANAALAAAEANVDVAAADVNLQEGDLAKTRILSPVNGIVLKRTAEPGQTVASSLQAPVLFTLAEDLTRMQVEANVDEADIGPMKNGQDASFSVDAYPGKTFPAKVETIYNSPVTTDNVVTYTAILTVDNSDLLLRPGMTATAQIVVRDIQAALVVPNAALRFEPPKAREKQSFSITNLFLPRMPRNQSATKTPAKNGERIVYVLDGGVAKPVAVKTGATDGQVTEILSGDLKAGDAVIVSSRTGGS